VSDFEQHLVEIARHKDCGGVICGHIHHPEVRNMEGILYLTAGDWIELLSVPAGDFDGNWTIHRTETDKR
jgi:UDP-2,3-diacylglucosamine pyrophosphatase LpxH